MQGIADELPAERPVLSPMSAEDMLIVWLDMAFYLTDDFSCVRAAIKNTMLLSGLLDAGVRSLLNIRATLSGGDCLWTMDSVHLSLFLVTISKVKQGF